MFDCSVAGEDVQAIGDLARRALRALLSFTTDGDDPVEYSVAGAERWR
ncbi:hypothetical protein [Streptomyces sp. x-80]